MPLATPQTESRLQKVQRLRELRAKAAKVEAPPLVDFLQACSIEDKETGALIPFALWPAQRELAENELLTEDRLLCLKARQLGWTWLILGTQLYFGTFWGHRLFLIVSQSGDDAQAAIRRLKIMHDSLPEQWRREIVTDNVTELAFDNGSRYETGKATKRYGRGKAAYAALADEIATWDWPEDQLAALGPGCKKIFAVTTGQGPGDYTHTIWKNAEAGLGRWRAVFHPWTANPDRDAEWYRLNVEEDPEPRRAHREYAATPEEAFAAPEGVFFERFSRQRNTAAVQVVPNWPTVRAVDFGYRHPACAWVQTSPAGQPFVVAELAPADMTTEEFIAAIKRVDGSLGLSIPPRYTFCDPAGNAANVQTAKSEVQMLRAAGLNPVSKASSIRDGCVRLIGMLSDEALPLVVSTACPWIIEALATVRPDKHRPDLYDESSAYCHILDALRYWAINRQSAAPSTAPLAGGKPVTSGMMGMRF